MLVSDGCGSNNAAAFSEADANLTFTLAIAPEDDLVAVFKEAALFPGRQLEGFVAATGQFEKATPRVFRRPGNRSAPEQVAGTEIATVARVVGEQLRDGPIEIAEIASPQRARPDTLLPHLPA